MTTIPPPTVVRPVPDSIFDTPTHYTVIPNSTPVPTPSPGPVTPVPTPTPGPETSVPTPAPGVQATTTTLSVTLSGSFPEGFPVTLIAAVTPRAAAGTVQFKDGNTNIGEPAAVINGTALEITSTLSTGEHSLTAVFTPADTTEYSGSTSPPVPLTVAPSIRTQVQLFIQAFLRFFLEGLRF